MRKRTMKKIMMMNLMKDLMLSQTISKEIKEAIRFQMWTQDKGLFQIWTIIIEDQEDKHHLQT
jgi:hypothetical protein